MKGSRAPEAVRLTIRPSRLSMVLMLCRSSSFPLLQCRKLSATTPVHDEENPALPTATAPPAAMPKIEDDMWNKRQIYVFYLGLTVALIFLIRPLLPRGFDQYFLAGFSALRGLGNIGLPVGIFGTSRFEKNCSRYIGHFASLCFSLMVIYAAYLLALMPVNAGGVSPCPPPSPLDVDDHFIGWKIGFTAIGFVVSVCHISFWVMGYCRGGDRDLTP